MSVDSDLLEPLSEHASCGDNLEYDPDFLRLEQIARGKPEQQYGGTLVPAEEPDWKAVRNLARALSRRSIDLRILEHFVRASLRVDGLAGFAAGMALVRRAIEEHWDDVHPRLDPEDDNDPTARINIIASFCDGTAVLRPLRETPLVAAPAGRFSLRDLAVASGEQDAPADMETGPTSALVDAAFGEAPLAELEAAADAARSALGAARAIESILTDRVGVTQAVSLQPLADVLIDILRVLDARLAARSAGHVEPMESGDREMPTPLAAAPPASAADGRIASRDDVVRMLDRICDYYERHEPSSPVPLLLRRARRLVPMSFMEIVQDLAPDGVSQVEVYRGPEPPA
jgi:type VI secretion system protein ImpA